MRQFVREDGFHFDRGQLVDDPHRKQDEGFEMSNRHRGWHM